MGCTQSLPFPINAYEVDLSHFQLERVIGQGGFGKVRACVKRSGEDAETWYAIKILEKASIVRRQSYDEVMREMVLLRDLRHPFICNVNYAFQDEDHLYLVMDVALGGDLRYRINHTKYKRLSKVQTQFYVASLILALEYLHSMHVLHRDIKPDNMLLLADGYVKLTDFGISSKVDDMLTGCTSSSGTQSYMAPEIRLFKHQHGVPSEAYSVGIVTAEMLYGRRLGKADRWNSIADKTMDVLEEQAPQLRAETTRLLHKASEAARQGQRSSIDGSRPSQRLSDVARSSEVMEFDEDAHNFIQQLLEPVPSKRLGATSISELKQHPFFNDLDFQELLAKKLPPPFLPDTSKANCETNSEDFLDCIAIDEKSPANTEQLSLEIQAKFEGYEYNTTVNGY